MLSATASSLFVCHIALQGCVRPRNVAYGLTADTGGHIKYVIELMAAAEEQGIGRQELIVRRFEDETLGPEYARRFDRISKTTRIVRIDGSSPDYLPKEELWREHQRLADSLTRHFDSLDRLPDVIHAHYADAGWLAAEMKQRLGIPFIFTGHSLGRVKARARPFVQDHLQRRILTEERAIAAADLVIASSTDEAKRQYKLYKANAADKTKVIPPGCDVASFTRCQSSVVDRGLVADLRRFLVDPSKPPILALARPVMKKNLHGLLEAFASSSNLRERANLIIFAGCRTDAQSEEPERRQVFETLLNLVDRHDLWGSVALPKQHRPEVVPHIYRFGAELGGVFANVALHEPFGLTLLEAAASGLPVVATNRGGPTDIIGRLQNGVLVNPDCRASIANALTSVLDDKTRWQRFARDGRCAIKRFTWERHAQDYVAAVSQLRADPSWRVSPILAPSSPDPRRHSPAACADNGVAVQLPNTA